MNLPEERNILLSRLQGLAMRAESTEIVADILIKQARRQRRELAAAMDALCGMGAQTTTINTSLRAAQGHEAAQLC